ncbi:ABC transporter ATP-binding protein [Curtobacterium ammoniigenes]|uniref:ABC transporter ATP-binding protein n=1 Tax=Curtobacterium ammoniigenes TaxID=395387 RepID=UPI0009FA59C7|nr:ABC transporter ATP-binding protein [Curtobacterium ammoniigenes]
MTTLATRGLRVAYDGRTVIDGLDLDLPDGGFTAIIGPNGCGKSTLLGALARTVAPVAGAVLLDGVPIRRLPSRALARRVALLPQQPIAPEGVTVRDLVTRGRYPHVGPFRPMSRADREAVDDALERTGVAELADRAVDTLSGGQRQRVWIALVLAQDTDVVLLDEPTTFLDIAHQYALLDMVAALQRSGRTVIAVLHDLTQAARVATHLVAMTHGAVVAAGTPESVLTAPTIAEVFGLRSVVVDDPVTGTPMVVPIPQATVPNGADPAPPRRSHAGEPIRSDQSVARP